MTPIFCINRLIMFSLVFLTKVSYLYRRFLYFFKFLLTFSMKCIQAFIRLVLPVCITRVTDLEFHFNHQETG